MMKKSIKICVTATLVSIFFIAPAAMAVVIGGSTGMTPNTESAAMLVLGASLVGTSRIWRKKLARKD